ncbi:hypothetical protein PINS_up001210 [Pythium insidiosum]|nr:hypothetical protein PINS_up001210 [Pythium insidiosum]
MIVGLTGRIVRERLSPALCLALFELCFVFRVQIASWIPSFVTIATDVTTLDYQLGVMKTEEDISIISPMRLWNIHPVLRSHPSLIGVALTPMWLPLVPILGYVAVIKAWRRQHPPRRLPVAKSNVSNGSSMTSSNIVSECDSNGHGDGSSTRVASSTTRSHPIVGHTQFESATGVALETQFGLVTDYDSYRVIKGMSSGFVIANGRFLVATSDILAIVLTKLLRLRFRNIYVYDVDGHTVQEMARLLYPDTLSFSDLLHLNVAILS